MFSLHHLHVQPLPTVRARPGRYSYLQVFQTDIDPADRGMLCSGRVQISAVVSHPNPWGCRGALCARVEEYCTGPISQKGFQLSSHVAMGKETEARTREQTFLGWALTRREFISSLLWVSASPLRGAGPNSVFWDLPGITQKIGLHPPQGLPAPKSPHAIGLAKGFSVESPCYFLPRPSHSLSPYLFLSPLPPALLFGGDSGEQGLRQS